jgi:hypothetical protein
LALRFIFLIAVLGSFLFPGHAFAQGLRCGDIFSDNFVKNPNADLLEILNINSDQKKADRKARKKIEKHDWNQGLSETEVRQWIQGLFSVKYGDPNNLIRLIGKSEKILDARLMRILQEEAASRGVIEFLKSRGLLNERDRAWTLVKKFFYSNKMRGALSVTSLLSLKGPAPFIAAPQLKLFNLTDAQMQTLLLYGKDSAQGKAIVQEILPGMQRDRRYAIFSRSFNRASFVVSVIMAFWIANKDYDEEAEKNGEAFVTAILAQLTKIAGQGDAPADTPDDILFDIVVRKISETTGAKPSADDLKMVCLEIPAINRCGGK